jgi:bifunctional non-homologous end joining protein LigD
MEWRSVRRPAVMPAGFIEPCNPTVCKVAPSGPQWVHEIKHDGYRLIVRKDTKRVRVFTRRGFDWTERYPAIRIALQLLLVRSVTIDGEAVYCGKDGLSDFGKLHSQAHDDDVFLYAFDLLELNGEDLRAEPLEVRKGKLERLLGIRRNPTLDRSSLALRPSSSRLSGTARRSRAPCARTAQ